MLIGGDFTPNREIGRWYFLDFDEDGKVLTRRERLTNAAFYYTNTLLPYLIGEGLIEKGEVPKTTISDKHFQNFIEAIRRRNLKYNEIVVGAGLTVNVDPSKYRFLYRNHDYELITRKQKILAAANYLRDVIIPDLLRKGILIEDQTPTIAMLDAGGYLGFFFAITNRPFRLAYNEVVIAAGFIPNEPDLYQKIGTLYGNIIKCLVLIHTRSLQCKSFSEVRTSPYGDTHKRRHPEISIIIDNGGYFENISRYTSTFVKKSKTIFLLNLDVCLGGNNTVIIDKCNRGYQGQAKFLIIGPVYASGSRSVPTSVPYRENVRILNPIELAKFLGFEGDLRDLFFEVVELVKGASQSDEDLQRLKELSQFYTIIRKKKFNFSQADFERLVMAELRQKHRMLTPSAVTALFKRILGEHSRDNSITGWV